MSIELGDVLTLAIFIVVNLVTISFYLSKNNTRLSQCERDILNLHTSDSIHSSKFETIYKLEAQLELLITHLLPKK